MSNLATSNVEQWLVWTGQVGKSQSVVNRVSVAGHFLEDVCRMPEKKLRECLCGIDFSKAVRVLQLPKKVYVQYGGTDSVWFTDTGLTPDLVGLAEGNRKRRLYRPVGGVRALKTTARSIKDSWTPGRIFQSLVPDVMRRFGQMTRGGGTQYIVADRSAMRELR